MFMHFVNSFYLSYIILNQAPDIYNLTFRFQKEEQQRPKTFIERLAEERDAKRRKVSKKVHTNRKSYVEVNINFKFYLILSFIACMVST
jgi:hypothetical protein